MVWCGATGTPLGLPCPAYLSHTTPLSLTLCPVSSPAGGWEGVPRVLGCGFAFICVSSEAARLLTGFLASRLTWALWCLGPICGEVACLLVVRQQWPWLSLSPCPQPSHNGALWVCCRWTTPRRSFGCHSSGTDGRMRNGTALPTSVTPSSCIPMNTLAIPLGL